MATDDIDTLLAYLSEHLEVTSVLITGGDPMIMGEAVLRRYIGPLIDPRNGLDHLEPIRIGTKSVAYWPQRFVSDRMPTPPCGCSVKSSPRAGRWR